MITFTSGHDDEENARAPNRDAAIGFLVQVMRELAARERDADRDQPEPEEEDDRDRDENQQPDVGIVDMAAEVQRAVRTARIRRQK